MNHENPYYDKYHQDTINTKIVENAAIEQENKTLVTIIDARITQLRTLPNTQSVISVLENLRKYSQKQLTYFQELQHLAHITTEMRPIPTESDEQQGSAYEETAVMKPRTDVREANFVTLENLYIEAKHLAEMYRDTLREQYPDEDLLIESGLRHLKIQN